MTEQALSIHTGNRGLALRSLDDMQRWAEGVKNSGLAPKSLSTASQILVATQYGLELGLTPMAALNSIAVIGNKPSLFGDAALALVRRSGLCEYVKESCDSTVATCRAKRKDQDDEVVRTFSVEDAKTARLWGKAGPWVTHPKRMLQYKARAFCLRDLFPDVLMGLHIFEELQGEDDFEQTLEKPACATPPRADRRKPVEATIIETLQEDILPSDTGGEPTLSDEDIAPPVHFEPEPDAPPAVNPAMHKALIKSVVTQYCDRYSMNVMEPSTGEAFLDFCLLHGASVEKTAELTVEQLQVLQAVLNEGGE